MITPTDAANLLAILTRVPFRGVDEAEVLIVLKHKLEAIVAEGVAQEDEDG